MSSSRKKIPQEMVSILSQFSLEPTTEKNMAICIAAKSLLKDIQEFNTLDEKEQSKKIVALRTSLLSFYDTTDLPIVYVADLDFKKLVCNILISLSEQFPINKADLIKIDKNDQFYSIFGQLFSLQNIIDYNKKRPPIDSLGENLEGKFLLDPITKKPFSAIDSERLILLTSLRRKDIDFLIDQPSYNKSGPAQLSHYNTLKDIALSLQGKTIINNTVFLDKFKKKKNERFIIPTHLSRYHDPIHSLFSLEKTINKMISLGDEIIFTDKELLFFMALLKKNNELRTYKNLSSIFTEPYELEMKSTPILSQNAANAFICLLSLNNEPKTLKEIADFMIISGYDLNHQFTGGHAAIHLAAQNGSADAMMILLDPKYNINLNLRDSTGETPLNTAARNQHVEIVEMLAKKDANVMIPRFDGIAPIHIAAEHDDAGLLTLLLEYKANIEQKADSLSYQRTAAHIAAKENSKNVTKILLEKGAAFDQTDAQGHMPFHLAAYKSTEVMELLLQHTDKFNINHVLDNPRFPCTAASIAAENNVTILKLLVEAKADPMIRRSDDGTLPLHRAAYAHPMIQRSDNSMFIFHGPAFKGNYAATAFLIDYHKKNQQKIFIPSKYGQSPFVFACAYGNWEIAKLLLKNKNDEPLSIEDQEVMDKFHDKLDLQKSKSDSLLSKLSLYAPAPVTLEPKLTQKKKQHALR